MRTRSSRRLALAARAIAVGMPAISFGGINFLSGSATWSWDADTNSTLGGKTVFTVAPPSSSTMPTSPTFQLNKSGSSGGSNATGKGTIGYVANSTTASYTFAGGSGAAQADPGNVFTGDTITKVQFGGLFDVTSPGFGPTATGYFSLTAAGVAGINGSTQIAFNMQWRLNGPSGALLRSAISDGTTFLGGATGTTFSKTWTYCSAFSPTSVSASDNIWVGGSLTFIADNHGTASDVAPIQFEASAAPPTATLYAPGGFNSDWFAPATWQAPDNPAANIFSFTEPGAIVPAVPNGVGQRARFIDNSIEPRGLQVDQPLTLGAIHMDEQGRVQINNNGIPANNLTFAVNSGNATVFAGASTRAGELALGLPMVLQNDLDVRVESDTPGVELGSELFVNAPITNDPGPGAPPRNVGITGTGFVNYNAANDYKGATNIFDGGSLRANAPGALGTGSVNVSHGMLVLNTVQPFAAGGVVNVGPGGQVVFGVPGVTGAGINFGEGSGFSGSPGALAGISVNDGVSGINIAPGGYVGHQSFDVGPAGNPGGLGNAPQYVFAISSDFVDPADPSIVVGSNSASPWIGFGSDRYNRAYGASPTDPLAQTLTVDGQGVLFSGGGELAVNARLSGAPTASTEVRGGMVSLNSLFNDYAGTMVVRPGATLRVEGVLPAVQSVLVEAGGAIGGGGSIGGAVVLNDGAVLDPGIGYYNNIVGVLSTHDLVLSPATVLDFEFGADSSTVANDRVTVNGSLTLDGELIVNQLQEFESQLTYVLFQYSGVLVNNGLTISPLSQEIFGQPAAQIASIQIVPNFGASGGVVLLQVPEPASSALLLAAAGVLRRRRGVSL